MSSLKGKRMEKFFPSLVNVRYQCDRVAILKESEIIFSNLNQAVFFFNVRRINLLNEQFFLFIGIVKKK